MIQYENGDIVIVRVRDKGASEYPFHFVKDMTCFSKKPLVVYSVSKHENGIQRIRLCDPFGVADGCGNLDGFVFSQPMLYPTMELI